MAEFLVARALGASQSTRAAWDNYDVLSPTGIRIEVKSSAYLQSWSQRRLSSLRFTGLSGLTWEAKQGWGGKREYRAASLSSRSRPVASPSAMTRSTRPSGTSTRSPSASSASTARARSGSGSSTASPRGPGRSEMLASAVEAAYRVQVSPGG